MKVLVIRFSSIGDIVLTSPVLRCLKEQLANIELHYLTKGVYQDLISFNPHVDKVHLFQENVAEVLGDLKAVGFDHVIDLHNNIRSKQVCLALGAKCSRVDKRNFEKWMMVNMRRFSSGGVSHIVERYLESTRELGVQNDNKGLELFIPENRQVALSSLPESHRSSFVALAIGAAQYTKRLPADQLIELCRKINHPITIIGGPNDVLVAQKIGEAIGSRVHDCTGKYDLLGSASLLAQARAVICHDSGAMHMACALNRPVVSIWGNTVPEIGFAPYRPEAPALASVHQVEGLDCRPCSKLGRGRCPKGHFKCMFNHDLDTIANTVGQHLS